MTGNTMDDLLTPLLAEYEALIAEQAELDELSDALESQQRKIDQLEHAAEDLLRQIREIVPDS